jgi:hypothetical protein
MKKELCFVAILFVVVILLLGCPQKVGLPPKYKSDNENFKQSIILLNEARDLSNPPESETQTSFKLPKEVENNIFSKTQEGLKKGNQVNDDYLDYLHPELTDMFKNKLIKGTELYYAGLIDNASGKIPEGASKQVEGNKLIIEWLGWWDKNRKNITDKVFGD